MDDIVIKDLSVNYENVRALENINLTIKHKQFLGIIGSNGGGKTTLLKVMLGLLKPTSGSVQINKDFPIGYVPQFTSFDRLFPISVLEVILMGKLSRKLKLFHKYSNTDIKDSENIMKKLGILNLKNRQVGGLSGGQMQKVLIARALINNPKILILDEPTASIDANAKIEIYDILKELNNNMTIIIVSHEVEDLILYADSIACLNRTLHYHKNNDKNKKTTNVVDRKYTCPVNRYIDGSCNHEHCDCCGGVIDD